MRNVCLKALVLTLTLVGLASLAPRSEAQQIQTLIQFTNSWIYDQSGRELGTAWRTNNYTPDAQWGPSSPGLFAFEPDAAAIANYNLHAPFSTPLTVSSTITTYYFRTTFTFTGATNGVVLIATNLVDDGCAVWLNGRLAGGVRVPATFNATTLFGGPTTEGQMDVATLTNFLRTGVNANTLAVEVHQSSVGSSDIVFGMKLLAFVPTQLAITTQPQSQTAVVGDTVTFSVGVSGGPVTYRWFKGNVLQASTSNTLSIVNAQVANSGTYSVIVSNSVNSVTSSNATLTVVQDTEGPRMYKAVINAPQPGGTGTFGTNTILIDFDDDTFVESLNSITARNTNNYKLISSTNPNVQVPILSILYSAALGALLQVDGNNVNWKPAGEYYLIVNNIADTAGNNIDPNSVIGTSIVLTTNLAGMSDEWRYLDCTDPICDETVDFNAIFANEAWTKTNFVVGPVWGTGTGIFVKESGTGEILPCTGDVRGSVIGFQFEPTLFRRTFMLPTNHASSGTLRLRYIFDDGMALYLNGKPLTNFNVNFPITKTTFGATAQVGDAVCVTNPAVIGVNNLLPGTNWLCAAVVQHTTHEGDTVFGLDVELLTLKTSKTPTNYPYGAPPNNGPRIVRTGILSNAPMGRHFVLSWPATNYGYKLMYSTNIAGSNPRWDRNWYTNDANWIQVSDQSNPYTNRIPTPPGPRRFYKLYREKLN